jgi:hypothetical protein
LENKTYLKYRDTKYFLIKMIFNDEYTGFTVIHSTDLSSLKITGSIKNINLYNNVLIIAANPIDRMTNYSGSGLPFPNHEIAFDNTKNFHNVDSSGLFDIYFKYPNSFYMPDGLNKIKPSIYFVFTDNNNDSVRIQYEMHDINALRTLVNRSSRTGPEFYGAKDYILPIDTAEKVMYAYARAKIEHDIG